jgi:hypothetical protein
MIVLFRYVQNADSAWSAMTGNRGTRRSDANYVNVMASKFDQRAKQFGRQ